MNDGKEAIALNIIPQAKAVSSTTTKEPWNLHEKKFKITGSEFCNEKATAKNTMSKNVIRKEYIG
jgi:hypothetical protein